MVILDQKSVPSWRNLSSTPPSHRCHMNDVHCQNTHTSWNAWRRTSHKRKFRVKEKDLCVFLQKSDLTLEDMELRYGVSCCYVFIFKHQIIDRTFDVDDEKLFWMLEMKQPFCVYPY